MRGMLPDLPDVDWSNPDVKQVLDVLGFKYKQIHAENAEQQKVIVEQQKVIAELGEINAEQSKRIAELEARVRDLEAGSGGAPAEVSNPDNDGEQRGGTNLRKYNTRQFKDYPRVKGAPRTREYSAYEGGLDFASIMSNTAQKTADILTCPVYGTPLSENVTDTYSRVTEDATMGGGWCRTYWQIKRRYCRACRKQHTAQPENVLPGEHYGINIMSIISILRNQVISFESIQKIILMVYGRFIHISTLEELYNSVSDKCRPLYEGFRESLKYSRTIRGDHTGWFLNGKTFYALVMISADTVFYHMTPTKSGMVMQSILQDYGGITLSDSDSSWNSIGEIWQKCLLHYLRNIKETLEKNKTKEFGALSRELKLVLKLAIRLDKECGDKAVPERRIQKLQRRIDLLVAGEYTDKDCKRYVKRLRREATHLLTFLKYDVEFHNNVSERALRPIARMRLFLYGSRSKRGLETTETMATIYATCEMRRVNPYHFLIDYLNGRINSIPKPPSPSCKKTAAVATAPAVA